MAQVTVPTIYKWWSRGFFAGIETAKSGTSGAGVRRRWSRAVVDRVTRILELRSDGYTSTQITAEFAIDIEDEADVPQRA